MASSIKDILSKTNQQVGLLDDDKKMAFAKEMSWLKGVRAAFMGQLRVNDFKTIIEWKRLLNQQRAKQSGHH